MNSKELVRETLAGRSVPRIPVSTWGHDFLREWSANDLADQTVERQQKFGYDFVKLNPRWTMFAEPWGNRYSPPTSQTFPKLVHRVVTQASDLQHVSDATPLHAAFREYQEALKLVLDRIADEVDVIATMFSPLAVAGLLCGGVGDPLNSFASGEKMVLHGLLERIADTLAQVSKGLVDAGAAGLFFAPLQWTSRDVCSPEFYDEFGEPYDLAVLQAVRDARFNLLHVCGDNCFVDRMLHYPVHVFNWDNFGKGNPSLAEIHGRTDKVVAGGIPHKVLHKIPHSELTSIVRESVDGLRDRVMLTGGCAIAAQVSDEVRRRIRAIPSDLAH